MEEEFVLGIIEKSYLTKNCKYSEEEIKAMREVPPVGPEIGPLVRYDFYHQHDIHCGPNGQYFKNFVPDKELCKRWSTREGGYTNYDPKVRDKYIHQRIYHGYKLGFYTERSHNDCTQDKGGYVADSGANVVFLSKDYKKTITMWNHDHIGALNWRVHMHDILFFGACYYSHRVGRCYDEFPNDKYTMFLQLFRDDGAIAAGSDDDGCFYIGALLEALKRIYIYISYNKAPFDRETILIAMRIVQEMPASIRPKFESNRPNCTYDIDFDEFMYFDVRYPNPDGSLNDIYVKNPRKYHDDDMQKLIGRPYKPLITSDTTLEQILDMERKGFDLIDGSITIDQYFTWKEKKFLHKATQKNHKDNNIYAGVTYFDGNGNVCDWLALYKTGEKIERGHRWSWPMFIDLKEDFQLIDATPQQIAFLSSLV